MQADPAAQGYARFNARAISALPCPHGVMRDETLARLHAAHGADVQQQLDEYTAELLQLTGNERDLLSTLATNRR
jgi:hypothetical protein